MQSGNFEDAKIDLKFEPKKRNRRKKFRSKIPVRKKHSAQIETLLEKATSEDDVDIRWIIIEAPEEFREISEKSVNCEPSETSSLFFEINNSNGESTHKLPFDSANDLSFLDRLDECPFYANDQSSTIDLITFDTEIQSSEKEDKCDPDDEIVSSLRAFFEQNDDDNDDDSSDVVSDEKSIGILVDVDTNVDVDVVVQCDKETKQALPYQFSAQLLEDFFQPSGLCDVPGSDHRTADDNAELTTSTDNDLNSQPVQEGALSLQQIDHNYDVPICQMCATPISCDMVTEMGQDNILKKTFLKPSLKKSNKNRDSIDCGNTLTSKKKKTHRVVFNESKNEFFEADYIILIREECDYTGDNDDDEYYDDDDDDNNNSADDCECTCDRNLLDKASRLRQQQNVQLKCCEEPDCCYCDDNEFEADKVSYYDKSLTDFEEVATISPPDGYKDLDLEEKQLIALQKILNKKRQQQGQLQYQIDETPYSNLCRDCLEQQENDMLLMANLNDATNNLQVTKIEQYPRDVEKSANQIVMETVTTTTVTERRIIRQEQNYYPQNETQCPVNGILKGGKMWKQSSLELPINGKNKQPQIVLNEHLKDDDSSKRTVRFQSDSSARQQGHDSDAQCIVVDNRENKLLNLSPESTEMMMTFKIGNQLLISNNKSLRPNSAVRQLFPDSNYQNSQFSDESVRKVIERNTLRRSLIKYEPKTKKTFQVDNTLVEKIKQLTCDIDDNDNDIEFGKRHSPAGEEDPDKVIEENALSNSSNKSTTNLTTNTSSITSSTYKKLTDLFTKKDKSQQSSEMVSSQNAVARVNSTSEARKQLLTSLAPFTACVTAQTSIESNEVYQVTNDDRNERLSTSSVCTDYSLQDIDEVLKSHADERKPQTQPRPPDVLHGTTETSDELAAFVQQDAGRIERLKKRYQLESNNGNNNTTTGPENEDEDDEHNDYGFNKRPNVRGVIKVKDENNTLGAEFGTMPKKKCQLDCCVNRNSDPNNHQMVQQQYNSTTMATAATGQQLPMIYSYEMTNQVPKMAKSRIRNRPQSPPPLEVARNYQQTMIFIPYNNLLMNETNIMVPQHMPVVPNFYHHQYMGGQMISSTTQTSYLSRQHKNSFSYSSSSSSESYRNSNEFFENPPPTVALGNYVQRSPSKSKFVMERGVPEGASYDLILQTQGGATTLPTTTTTTTSNNNNNNRNYQSNYNGHYYNGNGKPGGYHAMNV